MTWLRVLEQKAKEKCKIARSARTYHREFIAASDSDVDIYSVRLADDGTTAVPLYGDAHPDDPAALCVDVDIERMWEHIDADSDDEFKYYVSCDYSSERTVTEQAISPLLRPWDIKWSCENSTEDYFTDRASSPKPVKNSSGEPFDALPQRLKKGVAVVVTRNEAGNPAGTIRTYDKTVNSGAVTIDGVSIPAGLLLMTSITGDKVIESGVEFYRVTYEMKINDDGWHDKPLDIGYTELVSGEPIRITDKEAHEVTKPWPLDGHGAAQPLVTDTPATLDFEPYEEKSWAGLSFV